MPAVAGITLRISVTLIPIITIIIVLGDVLARLKLVSLFLVTPCTSYEGRKLGQFCIVRFFVLRSMACRTIHPRLGHFPLKVLLHYSRRHLPVAFDTVTLLQGKDNSRQKAKGQGLNNINKYPYVF